MIWRDASTETKPHTRKAHRWNLHYGLDSELPVTEDDRRWIESLLGDESGHPVEPGWVFYILGTIALLFFPTGGLAVTRLGWPGWTFWTLFLPGTAIIMGPVG